MKILRTIFLGLIFLICYLFLYKIYIFKKSKKFEKADKRICLDNNKLTVIFAGAIFVISSYTYKSIMYGTLYGVIGFIIPKSYRKLAKSVEKKRTLIDLLSTVETLNVQLSSNMPLKLALKNLPEVCKYSKFKNAMIDLYLEYQLTGFSLNTSLQKLKTKFPYTEILMFASAIEQHARGGNSEEAYNNLIMVLKDKNIEYIEKNTESKTTLLILGVMIILINLLVMGCYPIIIEVNQNLHTMLN